jgi:hypothetical protein
MLTRLAMASVRPSPSVDDSKHRVVVGHGPELL